MRERLWRGDYGLWRLLLPFSLLYGLTTYLIRLSYRLGWRKRWRAPIPVVVVGNLTVGGSGKTPLVVWLVEQLKQHGVRPGVVSRGYGGKAQRYPLLVTDNTSSVHAGDEPVLIRQRTAVPVAVAPNRAAAIRLLLQQPQPPEVIITDDGLQHYALQRDVEIVVIDGQRRFGNGWWLPAGPMRERANRLADAAMVVVNGGIARGNQVAMQLIPGEAINLISGEPCPLHQLRRVVAIAGIGHPARFFTQLKTLGADIRMTRAFPDHYHYVQRDLDQLVNDEHDALLMTEKDAVKCRAFARANWWYLPVEAVLRGEKSTAILSQILALCRQRS